jgi:hypothetical protein
MAAFVSPHHQATLNEMGRIVAAADSHASVLEILNAGPAKIISEDKSSGPTSNWPRGCTLTEAATSAKSEPRKLL